ncbi:MAG: methionine/alanine import family NSS transporter small subunit [Micrococcaceae bacterium]
MSAISIVMMSIMLLTIWGGMVVSMVHLIRNPDETSGTDAERRAQVARSAE